MFCKQFIRLLRISSKPQGIPTIPKKPSPTNKTGFFGLHLIFRTPCSFHGYQMLGHALQHLLMWKIHYCYQICRIVQGEFLNDVETILASLRSVPCHVILLGRPLRLDGAQMGIDGWNSYSKKKKKHPHNKKLTQLRFFLSCLSWVQLEWKRSGKERKVRRWMPLWVVTPHTEAQTCSWPTVASQWRNMEGDCRWDIYKHCC